MNKIRFNFPKFTRVFIDFIESGRRSRVSLKKLTKNRCKRKAVQPFKGVAFKAVALS